MCEKIYTVDTIIEGERMKKKKTIWNIISLFFTIILLSTLMIFMFGICKLNILPTRYLIFGGTLLLIIVFLLLTMMFSKKKKWIRITSYVVVFLLSFFFLISNTYLNSTNSFFSKIQIEDYDTLNYSIIVLKNSNYNSIQSLTGKTISYLEDDYTKDVHGVIKGNIPYTENLSEEFGNLSEDLLNGKTDAICLEEGYYTLIQEEIEDFTEQTKVIYTFEIKVESHHENDTESTKVTEDSFIVYISGVDQYGKVSSVRGRSDVNILMVVNPRTNHILLVNTPRDYYVQLAGTTGLKDKLTHAGIYGVNKSISTLENLYDIDINYYLRVNFDTLIKVVDIIGGIEIYSDSSYRLTHDKSYYVKVGMNKMNGKQALAYARERYAYKDGDEHRGANHQQIITTIIDKVTQSSVIISKYNSILNTLNGSFQTDMPTDMITSFIKYQFDEMPSWTVESIAVTGSDAMNYTYSMGRGRKLYVMIPDMNSVNEAFIKIKEVYDEENEDI